MKYIISGSSIAAEIDGATYSITSDHPQFGTIRDAIISGAANVAELFDAANVAELFDAAKAAVRFMAGAIASDGSTLFYKGAAIHGVVVDRILDFMAKGLTFQPLVSFLERLMENPSKRSVDELYDFIEANKLPITEDGFILGYKGVTEDYKDVYTETIDNRVGAKIPRLLRNQVDDNWRVACSSGYHVGSHDYAVRFGPRVVIVKVDPADVISVPNDANKMRVCYYEVVGNHQGQLPETAAQGSNPYVAILKALFFGGRSS